MNAMNNNGSIAVATENYLKRDAKLRGYNTFLIKANNPKVTAERLSELFKQKYHYIRTIEQLREENSQQNAVLVGVFKGFSVVAMLIGTFGILNNFIVSLLARQRSLAVMKSVGMSRRQTFNMLIIEAILCGAVGGVAGIFGGLLLVVQVNQFLNILGIPFTIQYAPDVFVSGFFIGVIIAAFSSVLPARKVAKMNIVSAIKYE